MSALGCSHYLWQGGYENVENDTQDFGDPPHLESVSFCDPPHKDVPSFCDPPLPDSRPLYSEIHFLHTKTHFMHDIHVTVEQCAKMGDKTCMPVWRH